MFPLGIIFTIFSVILFTLRKFIPVNLNPNHDNFIMRMRLKVFGYIAISLGIILIIFSNWAIVPTGHRGVITMFGQTSDRVLSEGLKMVWPLESVTNMNIQVQKSENQYVAETSDTQSVTISILMNWHPEADKINILFRDYGPNYADKIITPAINEAVRAEVSRHKVTDLIVQRPAIREAIYNAVSTWIKKYNLVLLEMAVANIDFSEKYDDAIETKQVEEQKAAAKLYELRGVETEAAKRAAQAKGEADAVRAQAQGEADALRIRGESQAEYNRLVSNSLTPLLVDRMRLEKWDGKLPIYSLGDAIPFFSLPEKK